MMPRRVLITVALMGASVAAVAPARGQDAAAAVRAVEGRRFAAMVARDTGALREILAEDLVYTHSSGVVEDRDRFIASIAAGTLEYLSIAPEEPRVLVADSMVVVSGVAAVRVRAGGRETAFRIRYTDVYVRREGAWRMVSWQSTRLPDVPPSQ